MPQTSVSIKQTAAFAGMLADTTQLKDCLSYVNGESSAEIPFGVMVKQGTLDNEAIKLTAVTDKLLGIVVHSHNYNKPNEIGDTGIKPDVVMNVLAHGRIWVVVEEAVTPASAVLVRAIAGGSEVAGQFRDTSDASDLIDISHMARYVTSAGAAELVLLEIDITNRGADVAD